MFNRQRRCVAWIAAFAVALQSLFPLIAQARADTTIEVPLCGVEAAGHTVEITFSKSTPLQERAAWHSEHCKACLLADGEAVLDAFVAPAFALPDGTYQVISSAESFSGQSLLTARRPRAPPQFS